MSRGPYSMLLMLAMSLPGAARALGLGDIRVDSALNEPLSAQIDILGASRDELMALTASVANREIFQRYGADRPSFLASATFKVGMDTQGRPVLNIRSGDAFTDPLVSFLVDLRWGKNEIVREYSLLLDPPGFAATHAATIQVASATSASSTSSTTYTTSANSASANPASASPAVAPTVATAALLDAPALAERPRGTKTAAAPRRAQIDTVPDAGRSHHKVSSGDTLRGIARRAGARSESQVQRMMIAIFRANPNAFDANINRLHGGALLSIPTAAQVEAVQHVDAKREVRAHMTAWRLDGRPGVARRVAAVVGASPSLAAPAASLAAPAASLAAPAASLAAPAAPSAPLAPAAQIASNSHAATTSPATATTPGASRAAAAAGTVTAAQALPAATGSAPGSAVPDDMLNTRVQSLERALDDMHKQLANDSVKIQDLKEAAARAEIAPEPAKAAPAAGPSDNRTTPLLASVGPETTSGKLLLVPVAVTLGLLVAGFAYVRRRVMQAPAGAPAAMVEDFHGDTQIAPLDATLAPKVAAPIAPPVIPETAPALRVAAVAAVPRPSPEPAVDEAPKSRRPALTPEVTAPAGAALTEGLEIDTELLERSYLESLGIDGALDTVVADASLLDTAVINASGLHTMVMETDAFDDLAALEDTNKLAATSKVEVLVLEKKLDTAHINKTELDYNLLDLDATAQHVHMPSGLNDRPLISERRTNIVDVLKSAIDRDPYRRDLRMKLLETYYSQAAVNQRAFVDVVRKLSREREFLSPEDWNKVMAMGREIASDDILFAEQPKDDDELAHCAA
ncbi:MAG: pilus assembly protein FimV [Gammaproteobacteria bacterium]|nr:pilus assembly protein FimV [Gammaproteobacteria bacterium]